jgi:CelD/BcsL family acetyltransferase involved in cellulose biosynthesis
MVNQFETTAPGEPSFEIFTRLEDAENDWRELFACATVSPYQSYDYVAAWSQTIGSAQGTAPLIVVARGADGRPNALYPLGRRNFYGLGVGEFLGGRESNFNLALLRPGAALDHRQLLVSAARRQAKPLDLFYLRNQPRLFADVENPLVGRNSLPSPSFALASRLPADAAALEARFSKDARKKLRSKTRRLSSLGALAFEHDARGARRDEIIAALVTQKAARLAEKGIGGFNPRAAGNFLRSENGLLEAHALRLSGRILAVYVGLAHRGRFCALFNSFDMDPDIARLSPCEILLHALLRNLVERKFSHFDLGVGEARYKSSVCEETVELCDTLLPVTALGALATPVLRRLIGVKRTIKQSPLLSRTLERARRALS